MESNSSLPQGYEIVPQSFDGFQTFLGGIDPYNITAVHSQLFQASSQKNSIIFVEGDVKHYESLIQGASAEAEIVVLDPTQDGVDQISAVLGDHSQISSLHIVSHGAAGNLHLGTADLNLNSLSQYQDKLTGWAGALTDSADILLYGCDVAIGAQGRALVQQLSTLTGADIAASTNLTGSQQLSGDWTLEQTTGSIESVLAFQATTLQNYDAVLASGASISTENIIFPADAGVIDVADYGAKPDDGIDDTAAIQKAIDTHPSSNYTFYFHNGVYDISNTLTLAGTQKRNIFQGQSQSGTILRLMDSVSPTFNQAIINFGPSPAQRFRNSMRNMTISVGKGHADAVGVQFNASNQGVMQNVTITSDDGQGRIGLDMSYTGEVGPLLIKDLTVNGFDYGIKTQWQTASQTFENITLNNQKVYGWWNTSSQKVFAQNVKSTNQVTAIRNDGEAGFVLLDSNLVGVGLATNAPAIINQKSMYVKNTETSGYALALDDNLTAGRGNGDVPIGYIEEYIANGSGTNRSGGPFELFASPDRTLGLAVQDSPTIAWDNNLNNWDGPQKHLIGKSGKPNDGIDDTASIQAAIDSGATTVYIPQGTWDLAGTLYLRGNVKRLIGTESILDAGSNGKIVVLDGTAPEIVIERLEGLNFIEHASSRTLVLNDLLGFRYVPTVANPGNLFINDCCGGASTFRNQNVWARQLNIEGDTQNAPNAAPKVLNDNSRVWILGMKTEDLGTVIKTINGGHTDLYGAVHVGSGISNASNPRFVTINASFSVAGVYGGGFSVLASETRAKVTRTTTTLNNADVYTAYAAGNELWGQWSFNGNASDVSGLRHNGQVINGAVFSSGGTKNSQALSLNGSQYVKVPNFVNPSQQMTVALWAKSTTATWNSTGSLVDKGNAFSFDTVAGTQKLRFSFQDSQKGGGVRTVEFDLAKLANFKLTDWHHYAATYDYITGGLKLYIDGIARATRNLGTTALVQIKRDSGSMAIGYNPTLNTYFKGQIDEVIVYGRALQPREIATLAVFP
jgi:polygalacturonase